MKKSTKSIKSISLILLAIVLAFSSLPLTSYAEDGRTGMCGENATWEFDSATGALTISGTGDMENYKSTADQPWHDMEGQVKSIIIQDGITSVGDFAFDFCVNANSVYLPSGITYIGVNAFDYCKALTNIVLPDTVNTIGTLAFSNCLSLESITVDENNSYFCDIDGVLYNKSVTQLIKYPDAKTDSSYSTPETLEMICADAIDSPNLTELYISKNVSNITSKRPPLSIGLSTRNVLKSITVDENNNYYSSQDNVMFNKDKTELLVFPSENTEITEYIIPDSVTAIGYDAFYFCQKLENIVIGKGLQTIPANCFYGCTSLNNVIIPENITCLESNCFRNCSSLKSFTVLNPNCTISTPQNFNETITLYGFYNSTLQTFAEENGYNFKVVCSDGTENHDISSEELEPPTCIEYGIRECTCSICGYSYTEDIPKTEHSYRIEEIPPTCMEDGFVQYSCSVCGDAYAESLGTISHEYIENVVVSPTCTQQGYTEYVCQYCGDTYQDNYTDAPGHNFSDGGQFCLSCGEENPDYKSETEETTKVEETTVTDDKTTANEPTTVPRKTTSPSEGLTNANDDSTTTKNRKKSSKKPAENAYTGSKKTSYENYRIIPGYGQIKAAWTVDSKLEGYEVYISTDNKHFKKAADVKAKNAGFCIVDDLKKGTIYYVKIKGYLHHNGKKIVMDESRVQALTVK